MLLHCTHIATKPTKQTNKQRHKQTNKQASEHKTKQTHAMLRPATPRSYQTLPKASLATKGKGKGSEAECVLIVEV